MKKTSFSVSFLILILCAILMISSCSTKPNEDDLVVVGHVEEFEVLYEEFRFVLLTYKQMMMDSYGDDIFDSPEKSEEYVNILRNTVYENITANYAVLVLCKEVGIEHTDEVLIAAVEKKLDAQIKELGGKLKYKRFLKENHMTDGFFKFNLLVDTMQNELFYVYTNDLELIENEDTAIYDAIQSEFIRTQHIYISKDNGKTYEENRASIVEAYNSIMSGADFLSVAKTYGEDTSVDENGFYIPMGYMSDKYDSLAFELSVGEFTDIVEYESGFYIIKRLELDPVYVLMNFNLLKDRYQSYSFLNIIDSVNAELEFKPTEYLDTLDILTVK